MARQATLQLDRRTASAILDGHPWIWPDVLDGQRARAAGAVVELVDSLGNPIGRALADGRNTPGAPALRVLTLDPRDPPLRKLLFRRIARARRLRERMLDLGTTTAFRLLNGEGDELPGLVVDRFGPVAVVRPHTPPWRPHERAVVEALRAEGGRGLKTILIRPKGEDARLLFGPEPDESVVVEEEGRRYRIRPGYGQKTGFFLDQRDNRTAVQRLVQEGDRTLDLFSFTGGFSVALATGGAAHVTSVDLSAPILEDVRGQMVLNEIPPDRHEGVAADIFKWLPARAKRPGPRFDVVVCDPPALSRKKADLPNARKAYQRLHEFIAPVIAPGGLLVTASCTARLSADDLLADAVAGLARGGRRVTRELRRAGAGADHPVPPALPQLRYLSCLVLALD